MRRSSFYFSIAAPTVRNKLAVDVQMANSAARFKSRLKPFKFRTVYNC